MTSILKVDELQDTSGNLIIKEDSNTITVGASGDTITIPSGATITNSGTATGFGKVLQVVTSTTGTNTQITSTSDTDTSLSANITPSSSSNKVLVLVSQAVQVERAAGSGREMAANTKLFRDSTELSKKTDSIGVGSGPTGTMGARFTISFSQLDSPSTTSQITYKTTGACSTTRS